MVFFVIIAVVTMALYDLRSATSITALSACDFLGYLGYLHICIHLRISFVQICEEGVRELPSSPDEEFIETVD